VDWFKAHQDSVQRASRIWAAFSMSSTDRRLLTVAFTHHTKVQGSAYSDAKLLFEAHLAPFDAVVKRVHLLVRPSGSGF
jgi:hypothetical protein